MDNKETTIAAVVDSKCGTNEPKLDLDNQQIIIDGLLALGFTLGNACLIFLYSAINQSAHKEESLLAVVALCAFILLLALFFCKNQTDFLQSKSGKKVAFICMLLGSIGSFIFCLFELHFLSMIAPIFSAVFTMVLFADFLIWIPRKLLFFLINAIGMYMGVAMLMLSTGYAYNLVMTGVTELISLVFSALFYIRHIEFGKTVSKDESKINSIKVRGNDTTIFLVGFMLGLAVIILYVTPSIFTAVFTIGLAMIVSGLISIVMDRIDEKACKNFMRKTMAATSCLLFALPLLPMQVQIVVLFVYIVSVMLNVNILVNAIIETSRFSEVSLIWLTGEAGVVFSGGLLLGTVLIALAIALLELFGNNALGVALAVACMICALFQIRVNYLIYPFEPVIEPTPRQDNVPEIENAGKRKAIWQRKIEKTCNIYRLSPRETEILHILLKGRDVKYIMEKFVVSQSTAKTHICNIYRKLGVHSKQELLDFVENITLSDEDLNELQLHGDNETIL